MVRGLLAWLPLLADRLREPRRTSEDLAWSPTVSLDHRLGGSAARSLGGFAGFTLAALARHVTAFCLTLLSVTLLRQDRNRRGSRAPAEPARRRDTPRGPPQR
jgi:hypothetical protein